MTQTTLGINYASTFNVPVGVVVDNQGNIWVAGRGNSGLSSEVTELKKNSNGTMSTVIFSGSEYGFIAPTAIAADGNGNIWVVNTNNSVTEMKKDNNAEGSYNPVVFPTGQNGYNFYNPRGITADPEGNIWVTNATPDSGSNFFVTEIKNNGNGTYSSVIFNANGPGAGFTFDVPIGVASDSDGNLWVANKGNNTVTEMVKGNGSYNQVIFSSTSPNTQNYVFNTPLGIAIDSLGNIWVANTGTSGSGSQSVTEIQKVGNGYLPNNFPASSAIVRPYALTTDTASQESEAKARRPR